MKKLFIFLAILSTNIISYQTFAAVDLAVTPLKYELKANPGDTITKMAKLTNKGEESLFITTGKSNIITNSQNGDITFVDVGDPNYELADWITIDTDSLTIEGRSTFTINFDIHIPENATPGGHYGAVFFMYDAKQNNNQSEIEGAVNIKANYGVLILVEVAGEIIDNGNAGETAITPGSSVSGWAGGARYLETPPVDKIDNCPYGDFSQSNHDGKCFDEINKEIILEYIKDKTNLAQIKEEEELTSAPNLTIDFNVPFENNGNTHIKPTGEITLIDEDGNVIKEVGVENILDRNGLIVGERIIDYLPINGDQSNVLPNTKKMFQTTWKGFPYKAFDENGEPVIKYRSPSEYYSFQYRNILDIVYFWQKVYNDLHQKKITAIIKLSYTNHKGEQKEFNSEKDFYVEYEVERIGYDPYFFALLAIFIFILYFILFIIKRLTKKRCVNCRKWIKKKLHICPYCGAEQDKKPVNTRTSSAKQVNTNKKSSNVKKVEKKAKTTTKK